MKNLTTILTELGIEVPEEKRSELEKQLGENYKPVSEVEKVRAARDNYKAQLDTAQETLKASRALMSTSCKAGYLPCKTTLRRRKPLLSSRYRIWSSTPCSRTLSVRRAPAALNLPVSTNGLFRSTHP